MDKQKMRAELWNISEGVLYNGQQGGEETQQLVETFAGIGLAPAIDFSYEHSNNFRPLNPSF